MFTVPESSSPLPTTPDSYKKRKSKDRFSPSHPSTTPLGPPPTSLSNPSTTPAGPPPSSVFGSNPYGSSFIGRTPPQPQHYGSRGSPLKQGSSRRNGARSDVMEEDQNMDDFDVSIQGDDDQLAYGIEADGIAAIARSLARRPAPLRESGDILLATDQILESLCSFELEKGVASSQSEEALAEAVQALLLIWKATPDQDIDDVGIGPGDAATDLSKAVFLSSLMLNLHHPARLQPQQSTFRTTQRIHTKSIPEVLVDWLHGFHNQYPTEYREVMNTQDGPAANEKYWDTIMSLSLRGSLKEVLNLLKEADFRYAASAFDDGADAPGYQGKQLGNIQRVVNRAASVIESCPAIQSGDWDVKGADWAIYRKRIRQALSDLETFAETTGFDKEEVPFEAENFGMSTTSRDGEMSISTMSHRATSRIPWSVYEPLKLMYNQVLGVPEAILSSSADWVEATIGIAVWWDGSDQSHARAKFGTGQAAFSRSQKTRNVDVRPVSAYQDKLVAALRQVTSGTDEAELQINTTSPIEVGLACIFGGDVHGLLGIVKGWSAVISASLVEVAHFGGWLNESPMPSKRLMEGFDDSDLMVLSVAKADQKGINRDEEMIRYAHLLNSVNKITARTVNQEMDGWELAVQVLSRVQNEQVANQEIANIIQSLEIDEHRIGRIMEICIDLDLPELARSMSEQYADDIITTSSTKYGSALYFYALAHSTDKLRNLLNTLIDMMLLRSCAYPPILTISADPVLSSLVQTPSKVLSELSALDVTASELLSFHFGGYATLRRFYDLRDLEVLKSQTAANPHRREGIALPTARNREALSHLITAIMSAADSIHGGLYDNTVQSVVPFSALLVLLGETLPFIDRPTRILSRAQIFTLLKAVEDVETVSDIVFEQCMDLFRSSVATAKGAKMLTLRDQLKKSTSDLSGESAFSLIGGGLAESEGSGILVEQDATDEEPRRAWDWRKGLEKTTEAKEVLQILRLGLASEVSRTWTET